MRRRLLAVALAALLVTGAACSGDDDEPDAAGEEPQRSSTTTEPRTSERRDPIGTAAGDLKVAGIEEGLTRMRVDVLRLERATGDAVGTDAYNLDLSLRRANAVRDALASRLAGVQLSFRVAGHGEARPVAPNVNPDGSDDPEGRQRNRRVTITYQRRGAG